MKNATPSSDLQAKISLLQARAIEE